MSWESLVWHRTSDRCPAGTRHENPAGQTEVIYCGLKSAVAEILVENHPISIDALRKGLQKLALLFFAPVTVLAAIWVVDLQSVSLVAMPLFGVFAILLGGLLAWTAAQVVGMPDRKTGAFLVCGSFSNIGSVSALVVFVYLGEEGFALVPMYKIFEEITYYSVEFPWPNITVR